MTTENTNFDAMMTNALSNVDETLEEVKENQERANPYKLNQALLDEGFIFDNEGVYVPFKAYYQSIGVEDSSRFTTRDDIYLFITRNPDKKLELNCKWAKKTSEGFHKSRGFNLDFTLDIGDEKELKALNKKVSFSGGKNNNPASEDTYVSFVDYFTTQIIDNPCLEVLKENSFEFPEDVEDEDIDNVEIDERPQTFSDYPEDIQHQAMKILSEGALFQEIQESSSLTHEGDYTTRNALILIESTLFVSDGAHSLLGGASGGGKSDLAFAVANNFPAKHVHILRNISPKNIYYDFESYDDEFNILILDDIPFNEDLVNLCKELTDNTKKVKELKTVINGKSQTFRLKGKYVVIITYAKTIPDEELANRLFNLGVTIIDKNETENTNKKGKIRDNNIIGGNENLIIERKRFIIQACIHYLIEQSMRVYNPYLSIFNPTNYNNRDVNHFINMTKARTFFEYTERRQIKVNDEVSLTIGSYEDLNFVNEIWAKDEEAQLHKLSERQKQILKLLPEMTSEDAYTYIEDLNKELSNTQSRGAQKKIKDNEPFASSLARKLKCSVSTLKHDLDRFEQGTHKSLVEIGLVDKIKLDEDFRNSPNFYYKVKNEGASFDDKTNVDNVGKISFAHSINSSIVKQKIIIDLLLYANIILNERGIHTLKNFCENYKQEIDVEDYNDIIALLESFFETLNYDEDTITLTSASSDDINQMMKFKSEVLIELQKKDTHSHAPENSKKLSTKNQEENSSIDKQRKKSHANQEMHIIVNNYKGFQDYMKEKSIDVEIASQTFELLNKSGASTLQEIRNYICENIDPEDFNNETTPLKIDRHVNMMYIDDLLDVEHINNKEVYVLQDSFIKLARGE